MCVSTDRFSSQMGAGKREKKKDSMCLTLRKSAEMAGAV